MTTHRSRLTAVGAAMLALALLGSACDALRDSEPFTATITYEQLPDGTIVVTPPTFTADNSFGQLQVDNQTDQRRGFGIDDLAIYEEIPARDVRTIEIDEAKDGRSYTFYDHKSCDRAPGCEVNGQMVVRYRAEEFR